MSSPVHQLPTERIGSWMEIHTTGARGPAFDFHGTFKLAAVFKETWFGLTTTSYWLLNQKGGRESFSPEHVPGFTAKILSEEEALKSFSQEGKASLQKAFDALVVSAVEVKEKLKKL